MRAFVVGVRRLDIVNNGNSRFSGELHGFSCYVVFQEEGSSVDGWAAERWTIRDDLLTGKAPPVPGCWIDVDFRRGSTSINKVTSVAPMAGFTYEQLPGCDIVFSLHMDKED